MNSSREVRSEDDLWYLGGGEPWVTAIMLRSTSMALAHSSFAYGREEQIIINSSHEARMASAFVTTYSWVPVAAGIHSDVAR